MNIQANIEVRDRQRFDRSGRPNRWSEYNGKTRVYFFHEDENVLENFGNRVARPRDLYATFLPEVAEKLGLPRDTRFTWSQKAGCRCGCSPGFVCGEVRRKDVFVTLTGAPKTNDNPDELALAANRTEQLVTQLSAEQKVAADIEYAEQMEALLAR